MHTLSYVAHTLTDISEFNEIANQVLNDIEEHADYGTIQPLKKLSEVAPNKGAASDILYKAYSKYNLDYSVAMRFEVPRSATQVKLEKRIADEMGKIKDYKEKNSVKNRKSESVTCSTCGTKVKIKNLIKYRHGNNCPCCGFSLLSPTFHKTLRKYEENLDSLRKELKIEQKRIAQGEVRTQAKFKTTKWLAFVAYDYHT